MTRASLIERLKAAFGFGGREARTRLFNELVNEGYDPSEIVSALECIGEECPVLLAGGDGRYRFLVPSEQELLTRPAQTRLLRMQKLGFIDVFQADLIMTLILQSQARRTGLKRLNHIISSICESGELLLRLDSNKKESLLN